jgi:hypothetical protein
MLGAAVNVLSNSGWRDPRCTCRLTSRALRNCRPRRHDLAVLRGPSTSPLDGMPSFTPWLSARYRLTTARRQS